MRCVLGADHGGLELKDELKAFLFVQGWLRFLKAYNYSFPIKSHCRKPHAFA